PTKLRHLRTTLADLLIHVIYGVLHDLTSSLTFYADDFTHALHQRRLMLLHDAANSVVAPIIPIIIPSLIPYLLHGLDRARLTPAVVKPPSLNILLLHHWLCMLLIAGRRSALECLACGSEYGTNILSSLLFVHGDHHCAELVQETAPVSRRT